MRKGSCSEEVCFDLLNQLEHLLESDPLIDEVGFIHPSQFTLLDKESGSVTDGSSPSFWNQDHKLGISTDILIQLCKDAKHAFLSTFKEYKCLENASTCESPTKNISSSGVSSCSLESRVMTHSQALLLLSSDFGTAWNARKLILSKQDQPLEAFTEELRLSKPVLSNCPKSEPTWSHRRWIIKMISRSFPTPQLQEIITKESELVESIEIKDELPCMVSPLLVGFLHDNRAVSEEETEMQEPEPSDTQVAETTQATKPRKRRLTSTVWNDFTSVGVESDGKERACVERVGIIDGAGLSLDVPTRWNSTYQMLVRALKFRAAFENMASFDTHYKSLPSEADWNRGVKICELLKPFSVITTYFSVSKYPTSNVYFTEVWRIERLLKKYAHCDDDGIREMIQPMQVKFDKYWEDYNMILAMGAVLDPRLKIEILEKAYETVDPTTSALKIAVLRENLEKLYKDYQARKWASSSGPSASQTPYEIVNESPLEEEFDNDLFELERSIAAGVDNPKTHLDIYLEEPRVNRKNYPNLDVLGYWKENHHRLSDLADMARDLLTIPLTTVASESAFSIGGRILTPYRNRLLPKNVQALLCARNWLRGFAEFEGTIQDTDEIATEDVRKTVSSSRVESSRSGDSNMQ